MVNSPLCLHQTLDNQTHSFILHEGSRKAVDVWAHHIEQLQIDRKWYGLGHIRLLVDAREAKGLPIRYLFEMLSDYNRAYEGLEPPHITLAYLRNPDTVILDVYHMMAEYFEPPLTVQFFTDEARAKNWLINSQ